MTSLDMFVESYQFASEVLELQTRIDMIASFCVMWVFQNYDLTWFEFWAFEEIGEFRGFREFEEFRQLSVLNILRIDL